MLFNSYIPLKFLSPYSNTLLPPVAETSTCAAAKEEWNWKDKYAAATSTPAVVLADLKFKQAMLGQARVKYVERKYWHFLSHLNLKPKMMQFPSSAMPWTKSNHI